MTKSPASIQDAPRERIVRFRYKIAAMMLAVLLAVLPHDGTRNHRLYAESVGASERSLPNIVVVLSDDLGYGDLGCYGHPRIETPHLDRFARQGVRFTACYSAAPNCSPARAGLLTGRTPYRVGIHNWIPMGSPMHLRESEVTIATLLRAAGYETCHVGKWHLCGKFNTPAQPQPNDHGFDHWFATQNNALPNHKNPNNFVQNGEPVGKLEGYSASLVVDEAIRWLNDERDREKPFFLYVCFHEPHEPIADRYTSLYSELDDPSQRAHHGNITQMDDAFGRLDRALAEAKLVDNTFLLFTSDNGPAITGWHPHGSAGPLRLKKGHVYEGGIRVPGMLRWPGHAKAGSTCDVPISGVDLLPTLCAITGAEAPADRVLDGESFLPALAGKKIDRARPLYWQFNRAQSKPKVALRHGDWKILAMLSGPELRPTGDLPRRETEAIKAAELEGFELYHLAEDIGERRDLAQEQPQKLRALRRLLEPLYESVRDESPLWPEWEFERYEAERIEWPDYKKTSQGKSRAK